MIGAFTFTACNKGIVLTPAGGETEGGLKGYVTIASQCTLTEDNNMAELNVTLHALKPGDIMGNAEITFCASLLVQLSEMQDMADEANIPTTAQLQRLNRLNLRWSQAAMNF